MPWMMAAAVVGSSLIGANAAGEAASTQAGAADRAAELQRQQFDRQVELQAPWREAGIGALNKLIPLSDYQKFGMDQFQADPGYAFRMSEGMKALERSAAARGGLMGGATGKALTRYGQDVASQEYQNAFNRYQAERQARLGPLQSLAGVGQTATNALGQAGQNYATGAGEALGAGAQARASGYIGGANAIGGGLNQYMNYSQNQAQNSLLQQALRQRGGYGPSSFGGGGQMDELAGYNVF